MRQSLTIILIVYGLRCSDCSAAEAPTVQQEIRRNTRTPDKQRRVKSCCDAAATCFRQGDYDHAIELATAGLKIDPINENLLIERANGLIVKGLYDAANGDLTKAITNHPASARARRVRGVCKLKQQDPTGATEDLARAIVLDPNDYDALFYRAMAWEILGKYDSAAEDLDSSIDIQPSYKAYKTRAKIRHRMRDLNGAIDDLTTALAMLPTDAKALNDRGTAKAEKGMFGDAIADYSAAIVLEPHRSIHYIARAYSFDALGEKKNAEEDLNRAVKAASKDTHALMTRAHFYLKWMSCSEALQDYYTVLELDPANSVAENRIALILAASPLEGIRNGDEAVKHATKACELSNWTGFAEISTLAAAYAERGDFDKAMEFQSRAIKLAPDTEKEEMKRHLNGFRFRKPLRGIKSTRTGDR